MRVRRLVLVVPGLLRPAHGTEAPPWTSGSAPHLAHLLAASDAPKREADGIDAVLAAVYGIARQTDWPLAPIRVQALGTDAGSAYWLNADPVSMLVGRDNVRLEAAVSDLDGRETDTLIRMLNAHFAADGLSFVAPRPDRWFVRLDAAPALRTHPLAAAIHGNLRDMLPSGPDSGTWRRWQDEIQMLLFDHAINSDRQQRGARLVNSLWFWGGGVLPGAAPASIRTYTDDAAAAALAAFACAPAEALPASLDEAVLSDAAETIVVAHARPPDPAAAERTLLAPAWKALSTNGVDAVILISDHDGAALVWTARRPPAWRRLQARWQVPELTRLITAAHAVPASDPC